MKYGERMVVKESLQFVEQLVQNGGPEPHEYNYLSRWFANLDEKKNTDYLEADEIDDLWQIFGESMSHRTMQGFVVQKPHGYAGDYEIIDKIYTQAVSHDARFSKWDLYFHAQSACRAVRNRKQYFINALSQTIDKTKGKSVQVLNVGSGPGRDMYEFFNRYPEADVQMDCVDQDPNAIAFASALCQDYKTKISFLNRNIFRFRPTKAYDLVWSAGLFDYLNNKLFKHLLSYLYNMVAEGGQLVIGNFTPENPTRPYMEFAEWNLIHRDEETLRQLALDCGIDEEHIRIGTEQEGVNLFMHIEKPFTN